MRSVLKWLLLAGVVYLAVLWLGQPSATKPAAVDHTESVFSSIAPSPEPATEPVRRRSYGYGAGSGHQAGYDWAEEHAIDDVSDCEAAGDHSNSPAFEEGCTQYVEENGGD